MEMLTIPSFPLKIFNKSYIISSYYIQIEILDEIINKVLQFG